MIRIVCRSAGSHRKQPALVLAVFMLCLLPACIVVVDDNHDDYYRKRWRLEVIVYGRQSYYPSGDNTYSLTLNTDSQVTGRADCMDFEGRYEIGRSSTLSIEGIQGGTDQCGPESLAAMYVAGLREAETYSGDEDKFIIRYGGNGNEMRFLPY